MDKWIIIHLPRGAWEEQKWNKSKKLKKERGEGVSKETSVTGKKKMSLYGL